MEELLKSLHIKTKNIDLYKQAFTHTSYAYEHDLNYSYETLEFLGDAIVDLVVSDYLYKNKDYNEGVMTKTRASYVCEDALYTYALNLKFDKYILLGNGEKGSLKKAILADVFEAFIAALYLDQGFLKTKEIALDIIVPYIENTDILLFNDYKSELQEVVQDIQKSLRYELISEEGPAHNKTFKVSVLIDDISYGEGVGHNKKEAEQEAAKCALKKLIISKE